MLNKNEVYFENQKKIIEDNLIKAKYNVKIVVAWINFNEYSEIIQSLLSNGIEVYLIFNDDKMNARYNKIIEDLKVLGMKVKKFNLKNNGIMHHKFCIIDNEILLEGSFNWTSSANEKHFENLNVLYDELIINEYNYQFKTLWELEVEDFYNLRKPEVCNICGKNIYSICVFEQDGYYNTKADVYNVCCCGLKFNYNEFFDIYVYNNLFGIYEKYYNIIEEYTNYPEFDECEILEIEQYLNNELKNYLSSIRFNRMNSKIIHAVGIYSGRLLYKDYWENFIKIIWKELYVENFIEDEYYIE